MNSTKRKRVAVGLIAAACAALLGTGTLALFSDNAITSVKGVAGSLAVSLDGLRLENAANINPGDHDDSVPESYIPDPDDPLYATDEGGQPLPVPIVTTPHALTFSVEALGNKSMRTRETIILEARIENIETFAEDDPDSDVLEITMRTTPGEEQEPEVRRIRKDVIANIDRDNGVIELDPTRFHLLYKNGLRFAAGQSQASGEIELGSGREMGMKTYYVLDDQGQRTEILPADWKEGQKITAIKYVRNPDIFDGVGQNCETEEASTVKRDESGVARKEYEYFLRMDKETDNSYQGALINIDVQVDGLQYQNTVEADWIPLAQAMASGYVSGLSEENYPAFFEAAKKEEDGSANQPADNRPANQESEVSSDDENQTTALE